MSETTSRSGAGPATKTLGLALVAVVVGFGAGYLVGPGPSPSAGLNWEPTPDGECTLIWVDPGKNLTFSVVPQGTGEPPYQITADDGKVRQCGGFKVFQVRAAQDCAVGGLCDHYDDYPLPWPPSKKSE